ncbi:hypothetical protein ABNN70_04885 [Sporolactobacillus sp. Y61]|uniref:Transporter n=1 Tax=Sporolactobacillus sp. Y61 TaxID=3160863 RepID=A0AAU8IHL4_9BACL
MSGLSLTHWLYALSTLVIIVIMICRRGIVMPTLIGTFFVASVYHSSVIDGLKATFNASLVAAQELFHIFLIITLMMALLKSLGDLGADQKMIAPIRKVMKNGHLSFLMLIIATYMISLFFWPTPAVPLICTLLLPAAVKAGLPRMAVAMTVSIAGQGMALSSDYIMQAAPALTAKSAGLDVSLVADRAMILSLITGAVALLTAYLMFRKSIQPAGQQHTVDEPADIHGPGARKGSGPSVIPSGKEKWSRIFAILVPLTLLAIMCYMFATKLLPNSGSSMEGGEGAAFIGGVAVILLILTCIPVWGIDAFDKISQHLTDGFIFSFRAMGPVIPISGFFLLGSSDFSGKILSNTQEAPDFLFDLIQSVQDNIPQSGFLVAAVILIVGLITGLDGSGFSGLPLVGGLSAALATTQIDGTALAAVGQMGAIWSGGGTIVAWSSLVAIAAFCRVSPVDLVRKNFIPVMAGLIVSTLIAVVIW